MIDYDHVRAGMHVEYVPAPGRAPAAYFLDPSVPLPVPMRMTGKFGNAVVGDLMIEVRAIVKGQPELLWLPLSQLRMVN